MKNLVKMMIILLICQQACASAPSAHNAAPAAAEEKHQLTCPICFDDKNAWEFTQLECTHFACTECLTGIIDSAIASKDSSTIRCPDCNKTLTIEEIREIIANDPAKRDALAEIMAKKAVAILPGAKPCPTPNCPQVIFNPDDTAAPIYCDSCDKKYCARCLVDHPANISCEMAAARRKNDKDKKDKDNAASEAWKKANTRPCPKCKTRIEKNDGCMHMTCTNPVCKYEFCWNCAAPRDEGYNAQGQRITHPSYCQIPEPRAAQSRQQRTGEPNAMIAPQPAPVASAAAAAGAGSVGLGQDEPQYGQLARENAHTILNLQQTLFPDFFQANRIMERTAALCPDCRNLFYRTIERMWPTLLINPQIRNVIILQNLAIIERSCRQEYEIERALAESERMAQQQQAEIAASEEQERRAIAESEQLAREQEERAARQKANRARAAARAEQERRAIESFEQLARQQQEAQRAQEQIELDVAIQRSLQEK